MIEPADLKWQGSRAAASPAAFRVTAPRDFTGRVFEKLLFFGRADPARAEFTAVTAFSKPARWNL